ncbi:hypothetical protein [Parafrankia sp. EUN1f]|uniref:hypothetical protein n=1 Tax=Parafrankia sp. EUN1f TaxID=102897 RepID=UPI0001C45620|nr:hypothetical protein [Parafrankia sp. EUN1f]EFC83678.1 hypothetical protein FrEUN1fDRAFT_3227 [Parafrankia sp. EUN1f]
MSAALQATVRAYRAELVKLQRPGVALSMAAVTLLTVLPTVLAIVLADDTFTPPSPGQPGLSISIPQLETAQGLVLGFRGGTTFIGLLVFVLFTVSMTAEFSQGTVRSLFLKEPRRLSWLVGRLGIMLWTVAIALFLALVLSLVASTVLAAVRDIDTGEWWTATALGEVATAYLNALLAAAFFAIAGTALGIALRSTTAALVVGIAWTFPLEHIVQDSWGTATSVLPGLVFDAVGRGGVPDASYTPALLAGLGYAVAALVFASVSLRRRDVTA